MRRILSRLWFCDLSHQDNSTEWFGENYFSLKACTYVWTWVLNWRSRLDTKRLSLLFPTFAVTFVTIDAISLSFIWRWLWITSGSFDPDPVNDLLPSPDNAFNSTEKGGKMTLVYSILILCQCFIKTLPSENIWMSITYYHIPTG
jgi:hypothetical protein